MTRREHYILNAKLSYPVMLGQLGHITVGVADSVMVGQLGAFPLAAVSLANSLFAVPFVFGMGLAYGITPLVANADGSGDRNKIARVLRNGVVLCFWAGLAMALLTFGTKAIGPHLGQDPKVLELSLPYLMLIGSSILPLMVFFGLKQFCEGLSDTKVAMRVSVGANLLNILLNYLLIFGHFGFPELGLNGAGWATLISRIIMVIVMILYVWKVKRFHQYTSLFKKIPVTLKGIAEIWKLGAPTGLQYIFEVGAFATAAIMIGQIGPLPQAAHQIAINLASVSYMMASAFGVAATIRVGNQLGRKDYETMRYAARTLFVMTIVFMLITGAIFLLGRHALPALYTDDMEVILIAGQLLIIATIFQLGDGLQVTALGALRGLSDVKAPTLITFVAYWVLALPIGYLLGLTWGMGATGIWYGLAMGLTISAGLLLWRFHKKSARYR